MKLHERSGRAVFINHMASFSRIALPNYEERLFYLMIISLFKLAFIDAFVRGFKNGAMHPQPPLCHENA